MEVGKVLGSTVDEHGRIKVSIEREREAKKDAGAAIIGLACGLCGTAIGGYGDLVGKVLR